MEMLFKSFTTMSSSLALIACFLLATTLLGASITAESIGTKEIQFPTNNPFTVAIGSHLFTVSKYYSRIIVNSTDPNYKSCDVAIDSKQGPVDPTIQAAATRSKKIIVTSLQSFDFDPSSDHKSLVNYTLLLVDPYACSVIDITSPTELVSQSAPLLPPHIVVRDDNTFDVFYWSQRRCSPCRFDDEGRRVQLQHSLKPERTIPLDFRLHQLSQGHNYAYTFSNGGDTSALKVLDQDFNVLNWTDIDAVVQDFADSNVSNATYLGTVMKVPYNSFVYNYTVFEFNSKLRRVFSNILKMSEHYRPIGANPQIDSKGTSYVTLWQSTLSVEGTKINLTRFDSNGRLIADSMEIAKVAFNQQYKVQTFLLQDKQYCLVIHELGWDSDLTKIKCIQFTNEV